MFFFFFLFLESYNPLMPMHFILIYLFLNLLFSNSFLFFTFISILMERLTRHCVALLIQYFGIDMGCPSILCTFVLRIHVTSTIRKFHKVKEENEWEQSRHAPHPQKRGQKFYFQFSHWHQPITCIPFWIRSKWKSNYKFNTE